MPSTPTIRTILLALALVLAATGTWAEWKDLPPSPPFKAYSPLDGLAQAHATHIAQDAYGYLWVTTQRGLSSYDGREFRSYTIADGLAINYLTYVTPDGDDVWIGDAQGNLSTLRHGQFHIVHKAAPGLQDHVTGIVVHGSDLFFVVKGAGLFRLRHGEDSVEPIKLLDSDDPVHSISRHGDDLWMYVGDRLLRQNLAGDWNPVDAQSGVLAFHLAHDGQPWIVTDQNAVGILGTKGFERQYTAPQGEPVHWLTVGAEEVWLSTASAVYGYSTRSLADGRLRKTAAPIGNFAESEVAFVDQENTLWVATSSSLSRYLGDRFEHLDFASVGLDATVWSIAGDGRGTVFFGTQRELIQWRDGRVRSLNELIGLPSGPVRDIVAAGDGDFFVGVRGDGVYRFKPAAMTTVKIASTDGLEVLDLASDGGNGLWIGTYEQGLLRLDVSTSEVERISHSNELSVYTLDISPDGSIWYGSDNLGLVQVNPDDTSERQVFGRESGFDRMAFDHVRVVDPALIWVGTEDGGLYRFDGSAATNIAPGTDLRDQTTYFVEPAPDGTLIVGGEEGLYQIDPESLRSYHYSAMLGFVGIETNVHATFHDTEGGLWVGTITGATRMDTDRPMATAKELKPHIVNVSTGLTQSTITAGETVDWRENGVSFEYVAISLLRPGAIEYSYRLTGLDTQWRPATTSRHVDFTGLAAGEFEFEVRARFPNEEWSETTAGQTFVMLAPFWRQTWFIALVAVLAILSVPLIINIRTKRIEDINRQLQQKVSERTRSIERARLRLEESNRKLGEEADERRKADLARLEMEERFRRAFESSPIGMALLTPERDVLDANSALQTMLWSDADGMLANPCLLHRMPEEERASFEALLAQLESGALDAGVTETSLMNSLGVVRDVVINLAAIWTEGSVYRYSVCQIQDVTDARRMNAQLAYQARYDELTRLLNRRAFSDALDHAYREAESGDHKPSFLMFMDLDQFKIVNDTSGHAAGDELLKLVSALIREQVRANDTVARLGGDEFALLLNDCPQEVALRIAEKIRMAIEDFQFNWGTEVYRIGVSIGAVPFDPSMGDVSELQQLADAACYSAKNAGRNRVYFTRPGEEVATQQRGEAQWVQRLRDAMDHHRFALYGQTIKPVDQSSDEPERMEVLLRMRDPDTRKLISPGAFLPAAERFGLSTKLDEWVVENLIRTLLVHQTFGADQRCYWVNLSGESVGDERFGDFLEQAILNSPLPPGTLNFEVTETAVIRSISNAGRLMARLRELGCRFALDDFGSGLSSFGYLKKLPVDFLNIDGMIVRDILDDRTDRILVRSIIDIAHSMDIQVVTKFVEHQAIFDAVVALGTDYVQGYGIHRPEILFPQFPSTEAAQTEASTPFAQGAGA